MRRLPISFVCHWNNRQILDECLIATLEQRSTDELLLVDKHLSLSSGYAEADQNARHNVRVFLHQDVLLPKGWRDRLDVQLDHISHKDNTWGIIGVFGARWLWRHGVLTGIQAYGNGKNTRGQEWLNFSKKPPARVDVIDSVVLIKRRGVPIFDSNVPTFHGVAEDICMQAKKDRLSVWTADLWLEHRSSGANSRHRDLDECAYYLANKWGEPVPSVNPIWEYTSAILEGHSTDRLVWATK